MFEEEAEEYGLQQALWCPSECGDLRDAFKDGAEFGYQKAMKEWRDCFMSCSSPYCADKFRDIQCGGILGNMTKEGKENDPDKLTDDVMNDWKEMEDVENDSSL